MKTSELIALLLEADPEGNQEVAVGNHPIVSVQRLPAYYDGRLQVLVTKDGSGVPKNFGDVVMARLVSEGDKVCIETQSIKSYILERALYCEVFPVEADDSSASALERVAEWREEARKVWGAALKPEEAPPKSD